MNRYIFFKNNYLISQTGKINIINKLYEGKTDWYNRAKLKIWQTHPIFSI